MRSAWALGHEAPTFWAPVLQEAKGREDWQAQDLAAAALLAARLARLAQASKEVPNAAVPAAWALLEVLFGLAVQRIHDFGPREVGLVATAMVRSGREDGYLFAALAHQALQLLREKGFKSLDLCQRPGHGNLGAACVAEVVGGPGALSISRRAAPKGLGLQLGEGARELWREGP